MNVKMILATATLTTSLLFPNAVYATAGVVTETKEEEVAVECVSGDVFCFEDDTFPWYNGDVVALLMSDNGTPEIEDDEILCHKYVGTAMDFFNIFLNSVEE